MSSMAAMVTAMLTMDEGLLVCNQYYGQRTKGTFLREIYFQAISLFLSFILGLPLLFFLFGLSLGLKFVLID
jgi:hypothetical protein